MSVETTIALSNEEDTFALSVLEYGGNLAAAYRAAFGDHVSQPGARARLLISRPEIAKRIRELTELVQEHALISLGSHLQELAEIRDLAKTTGQLKVALEAEKTRGVVAGVGKNLENDEKNRTPTLILNIQSTPESVQAWAARQGVDPVIIENGSDGRS